jgi:ankyrin repeat protein
MDLFPHPCVITDSWSTDSCLYVIVDGQQLCKAAIAGDCKGIEKLLKQGADINQTNEFKFSALMLAASNAHGATVRFLLENRADVKQVDQFGACALFNAAVRGYWDIYHQLLNAGADSSRVVKRLSISQWAEKKRADP